MTQYGYIWLIPLSRCWELAVQDLYLMIRIWSVTQGILSTVRLYLKNCSTKIQWVQQNNKVTYNACSCPCNYRRGLLNCLKLFDLQQIACIVLSCLSNIVIEKFFTQVADANKNLWGRLYVHLCVLQDSEVSELSELSDEDVKYQKVESRLRTASPAPSMEDPDNVVRNKL